MARRATRLSSRNLGNVPHRLYSGGMGLARTQLPLTYWKKSWPGATDVSNFVGAVAGVAGVGVAGAAEVGPGHAGHKDRVPRSIASNGRRRSVMASDSGWVSAQ